MGGALVFYGATCAWANRSIPGSDPLCKAWLCPEEFYDQHVGELLQQSFAGQFERPIDEFRRALLLDSSSAYNWANLGDASSAKGDLKTARYCFQQAVVAAPRSPAILFRAANFYFKVGEAKQTMRCLMPVLSDPGLTAYYLPVFLTYTRMGVPMHQILSEGIPHMQLASQSFLRFLMEGTEVADAETTWQWIRERGLADEETAGEYVDFLIRNKQAEIAAKSWADLNRRAAPDYYRTNWVFNGGFETKPEPSLLDWHVESTEDVQANRTKDAAHDGRTSLQLVFGGNENVDYHQVWQETVLTPGRWRLGAFVKTNGLTTDRGVTLGVSGEHLDAKTEMMTGTHDWTRVESVFDVGPRASVVRVEVMRQRSTKFDSKIAGTAWIDSVELSPVR